MTDAEFLRVFSAGVGTGFLLGIVVAGYVALGYRERRPGAADNTMRRLYGAWRRKRRLT
ncbi:hypothetical protein [Anaeroselena agilis]|uniref:Uncharacterized protein n=1 Tax=Anaeroselena agilis TaxID=3063788 RepID=A0ABU3NVD3_9FIRM|nr:hypothetical protein [Selenomonadales bacterium 4137-cl]